MKFKYVIMTSITAIFLLFVAFLGGNSESDTSFSNVIVEQKVSNKTPVKENIPKEEPIKIPEIKTEEKKDSVDNYTIEQQKKGTYFIRDDNYIPLKLNPLSDPNYIANDLTGYEIGKYSITIRKEYIGQITSKNLMQYLANHIPYDGKYLEGLDFLGRYIIKFNIESNHDSIVELESYLQEADFIYDYGKQLDLLPEFRDKPELIEGRTIEP